MAAIVLARLAPYPDSELRTISTSESLAQLTSPSVRLLLNGDTVNLGAAHRKLRRSVMTRGV